MDNQYAMDGQNNSLISRLSLLHWEGNPSAHTYLPVVDKELSKPIHGAAACWGRRHIHPSIQMIHASSPPRPDELDHLRRCCAFQVCVAAPES
jgi:hypothetical protein